MRLDPRLLPYLPYVAAILTATFALTVAVMLLRRPRQKDWYGPATNQSADWEIPNLSFADRRSAVRRDGAPVKVILSSPIFPDGLDRGYVLDRSTGGLRIAMGVQVPAGTAMQVRAHNAPDTTPWWTVVVRSCRANGRHFEVGCAFDKTPPWNVLLLFG